ncbi:AraC family transcriptional regulator [Amycolatopsis sp. 3B14]|uniref:AraC family transcriptional regulator n=1 Tax=Amycolatopsis sp. 3B14 TaxID=3243600 RepID=UPI003D95A5C8
MAHLAPPEPRLTDFQIIDTHDIDLAHRRLSEVFCDHELRVRTPRSRFSALLNVVPIRGITVTCIRFGSGVRTSADALGFFGVQLPYYGRCQVLHGNQHVLADPTVSAVTSPTRPVRVDWQPHCTTITLKIERSSLEAALSAALGYQELRRPLEFATEMDLRSGPLRTWSEILNVLVNDIERGGVIAQQSLAASNLEYLLLNGLLQAQPHNYTEELNTPARTIGARAVRQAVEFIRSHPEKHISAASLARAAGVSVRSLQESFRQELNLSPMQYLRMVRLDRVHDDLVAARDLAGAKVMPIATRWGFTHMSRFATAYRKRFGETALRNPPTTEKHEWADLNRCRVTLASARSAQREGMIGRGLRHVRSRACHTARPVRKHRGLLGPGELGRQTL